MQVEINLHTYKLENDRSFKLNIDSEWVRTPAMDEVVRLECEREKRYRANLAMLEATRAKAQEPVEQ